MLGNSTFKMSRRHEGERLVDNREPLCIDVELSTIGIRVNDVKRD